MHWWYAAENHHDGQYGMKPTDFCVRCGIKKYEIAAPTFPTFTVDPKLATGTSTTLTEFKTGWTYTPC